MKRIIIIIILSLIIDCGGGNVNNLYQSIPKQIMNWKAKDKDEIYNRETLYDYLNGGAELYLTYDFKQVIVRRFIGLDQDEIVLDIYDMSSSTEAFGIFSIEFEEEDVGIGQGSEYGSGLLRFWKERFFVSIITMGDEQTTKPAILELGRAVAAAIDTTGPEPALLKFLPEKKLQKDRIRYLHSYIPLNNHYYIASENILNLDQKTDCVFAEYRVNNEDSAYLLLIQYENELQAKKAHAAFLKIYMPEALETEFAQMENQKWTMAKTQQNMVKIVFEAPDKNWASELLSAVK